MIDVFAAGVGSTGSTRSTGSTGSTSEERKQVAALAEQFEAMLLSQMLREMKESMTSEQEEGGFGAGILGETVNSEFGMALSKTGGVGLAESLMKALEKLDSKANTVPIEGNTTPIALEPPAESVALPVTSNFGWRNDPLNGQHKFHKGTDIRMAYGEEVRAAAGGVVTFAGEQPGYGLIVKVDHGNGLETRYAHLSSTAVREGQSVEAGSPIARSGNSGRTTGPHLHFEVRQDGQAIDPDRVTGFVPVAVTKVSAGR